MAVVDAIPAWLTATPPAAASDFAAGPASKLAHGGAVEQARFGRSETEGTPAFSSDFATDTSSSASSSSNPQSQIQNPQSLLPDSLADILLSEIAAGFQSLTAIAAAHHIPYPKFTLWLLQPATQQKLSELSTAIAAAARLTATAALPDIVRGLKSTLEQLNSHAFVAVALPGADPLRAQSLTLRRHRAAISASALLYRISRFTVPSLRPTPPRRDGSLPSDAVASAAFPTSPKGEVPAQPGVGAPAFSPALSTASSSLPTSDIPLPTSDISPCHRSSSHRDAIGAPPIGNRSPLATSPKGEVRPKAGEGAPELSPAFSTASSSLPTSDFPHPTSDISAAGPAFSPGSSTASSSNPKSQIQNPQSESSDTSAMPLDEATQTLIEDLQLTDEQAADFRANPRTWLREHLHEFTDIPFIFDDFDDADDG